MTRVANDQSISVSMHVPGEIMSVVRASLRRAGTRYFAYLSVPPTFRGQRYPSTPRLYALIVDDSVPVLG